MTTPNGFTPWGSSIPDDVRAPEPDRHEPTQPAPRNTPIAATPHTDTTNTTEPATQQAPTSRKKTVTPSTPKRVKQDPVELPEGSVTTGCIIAVMLTVLTVIADLVTVSAAHLTGHGEVERFTFLTYLIIGACVAAAYFGAAYLYATLVAAKNASLFGICVFTAVLAIALLIGLAWFPQAGAHCLIVAVPLIGTWAFATKIPASNDDTTTKETAKK